MELKKLSPRHKEIIRRLICGERNKDICADMGIDEQYLSILKSDPLFKAELESMEAQLRERFVDAVAKGEHDPVRAELKKQVMDAIKINYELMTQAASEAVRQKSAWDILDRAGYKPVDRIDAHHSVAVIDDQVAKNITAAVQDLAKMTEGGNSDGV